MLVKLFFDYILRWVFQGHSGSTEFWRSFYAELVHSLLTSECMRISSWLCLASSIAPCSSSFLCLHLLLFLFIVMKWYRVCGVSPCMHLLHSALRDTPGTPLSLGRTWVEDLQAYRPRYSRVKKAESSTANDVQMSSIGTNRGRIPLVSKTTNPSLINSSKSTLHAPARAPSGVAVVMVPLYGYV